MRVTFYCANKHLPEIDFSEPIRGNPGCGAAEYLHVSIPFILGRRLGNLVEPIILADNISTLPEGIENHKVDGGIKEAAFLAKKLNSDIFVFRSRINEEESILEVIDQLKLNSIGRAALTPSYAHQIKMSRSKYFKVLVCVGENQYYQLIDSPIRKKIHHINNGISDYLIDHFSAHNTFDSRQDIVFMGSLVPQKNFHYLAKVWKLISYQIPTAKLHVIGSANTYGINSNLGERGLAEKNYEDKFFSLLDSDPISAKKVLFHGNLGLNKYEILAKSRVGIVNPLGTTETCCVSAVEMQALGIPVCTGNYESLKTTILDKISGLLSNSEKEFVKNVIQIYRNKILFNDLSIGARANAKFNFSFNKIIIQGIEDFLGDMDFKVAGTEKGITALQMDMKITGLSVSIIADAIKKARPARLHILEKMQEAIDKPQESLSPHAPRLLSFRIDPELIGTVIGPGGRTIKGITERTNTKIDIEDGGIVTIASHDGVAAEEAQKIIEGLTRKVHEGEIFSGVVTRIIPIGAFVEILPGKEGMVHISQLSEARVERVEDVVRQGDEVTVRVREIDSRGRINLTLRGVSQNSGMNYPEPTPTPVAPLN